MAETSSLLDDHGRPLPDWMQDHLTQALAQPLQSPAELDKARAAAPPPLALKMCAACTSTYAVEGDVGDEQGGSPWFGPCCPVPPRYQDTFINPLKRIGYLGALLLLAAALTGCGHAQHHEQPAPRPGYVLVVGHG